MRSGIDIASYQHPNDAPIDYQKCIQSGVSWVCVKVDEGTGYVNPYMPQDLDGFAQAGAEVAVYHFAQPGKCDPTQSALHFAAHIPAAYAHVTRALDLEVGNGLSWNELARWAEEFQAASGAQLLYVNRTWQRGLTAASIAWPGLWWIAAPSESIIPPEAAVWQCGTGEVPGIVGTCDLDLLPDMEEPDMTPDQANQLAFVVNTVTAHNTVLQEIGGALDEIKARLTALEGSVGAPGGGSGGPLTVTLSGTATPT